MMVLIDLLSDYATLRLIWWVLVGVLFWAFALSEGFDLGVASISAVMFDKDEDRRIILNTVGPVWEGNQIALILGAGAIFATWPFVYTVLFTGLYIPITLVLFTLILRPVGFKYRSKIKAPAWRSVWDWCLFLSGALASLSFGCILGAMISGLQFNFNQDLQLFVNHNILQLLQPLPLCSAFLWLLFFVSHGGIYLILKTEGAIKAKMQQMLPLRFWVSIVFFFLMLCVWKLTVPERSVLMPTDGPSNPLHKSVMEVGPTLEAFGWIFQDLFLISFIVFVVLTGGMLFFLKKRPGVVFILSSLRMGLVIGTMALGNFPLIVASVTYIDHSLTVWDASSSYRNLLMTFVVVLIFLPIVLICTSWVYRVFRGPVKSQDIQKQSKELY